MCESETLKTFNKTILFLQASYNGTPKPDDDLFFGDFDFNMAVEYLDEMERKEKEEKIRIDPLLRAMLENSVPTQPNAEPNPSGQKL